MIERNAAIDREQRDYIVDFVIRAPDGHVLAIFAGTGELKALESLLFWERIKAASYRDVRSMIVLEHARPATIKARTLSRVMNSGLTLATADGGLHEDGEKIGMTLYGR